MKKIITLTVFFRREIKKLRSNLLYIPKDSKYVEKEWSGKGKERGQQTTAMKIVGIR